ncbi:hypothetical protein VNO78_14630 [Psophocarpus tetragonolobus]|uniref:Uncharacterized protein n=1 Tax=Psophocarpus tetragonolobus TaxID=3891 RepID=A0AAN9SD82_PSOTE
MWKTKAGNRCMRKEEEDEEQVNAKAEKEKRKCELEGIDTETETLKTKRRRGSQVLKSRLEYALTKTVLEKGAIKPIGSSGVWWILEESVCGWLSLCVLCIVYCVLRI